jgi:hypothetical protein
MSGDERSWNDGDKLSFSERDRLRRERRSSDPKPKGVSQARVDAAAKHYVKGLDALFSKGGGAEAKALADAIRKAHATPQLAEACRKHRDAVGFPADGALLAMFLDSGDVELMRGALETLRDQLDSIRVSPGLRSQIRMLAEDPTDEVASLAEELAPRL